MSDTSCRFVSNTEPRVIPGEHLAHCENDACDGCRPCPERHCASPGCRGGHLYDGEAVTCARCVGLAREDLALIGQMTEQRLDEEAQYRGVDSEAMMLNGPTADVEAWGHRMLSASMGRVDAAYLEDCRDELHPLWVLGTWEFAWREHLGHDAPKSQRVTVSTARQYLADQLTYMAQQEEPDFSEFAREIRACRSHLEDVLQEGERAERGAPCPECRDEGVKKPPALVREYVTADRTGAGDKWVCGRCKAWWSEGDYRKWVGEDHIEYADELTAHDMVARANVKYGKLRKWAAKTTVSVDGELVDGPPRLKSSGRSHDGRKLYRVADVLLLREQDTESDVA